MPCDCTWDLLVTMICAGVSASASSGILTAFVTVCGACAVGREIISLSQFYMKQKQAINKGLILYQNATLQ